MSSPPSLHTETLGDQGECALQQWSRGQTETDREQVGWCGDAPGRCLVADPPRGLRGQAGPPVLQQPTGAQRGKPLASATHTQGWEQGGQQDVAPIQQRQPTRGKWWKWPLDVWCLDVSVTTIMTRIVIYKALLKTKVQRAVQYQNEIKTIAGVQSYIWRPHRFQQNNLQTTKQIIIKNELYDYAMK